MKKIATFVLYAPLVLAFCVPTIAHAGSQTEQTQAQKMAQRAAASYNKELRETQKRQDKAQRKQMREWKKNHPTTSTVSYK